MEFSPELLQAALEGLLLKHARVAAQIETVKRLLGGKSSKAVWTSHSEGDTPEDQGIERKPRAKRILSPEARQRIVEAQKKRWAARRGNNGIE